MHQITLFQDKESKNFLGRPHSQWCHAPPPIGASMPTPPLRKSWIRHCCACPTCIRISTFQLGGGVPVGIMSKFSMEKLEYRVVKIF